MKITAVTACVNYVDYLSVSFFENRPHFDEFIVVTDTKDKKTHEFCEKQGIKCVKTDAFYNNGKIFDRGHALNYAFLDFKYGETDWVAHLDADTFVQDGFRESVSKCNREVFYGAQRTMLPTYEDYLAFKRGDKKISDFETPEGFGYGYFQLFNWFSSVIQSTPKNYAWYPSHNTCCESDWMFRQKWGDFVPHTNHTKWHGKLDKLEKNVLNLGKHGTDHYGRVSPQFIPHV